MTKQHHSNRLDATRKTGRFWEYPRRAFAGVLPSNQRNPPKPSKLAKLPMTNSQEFNSIAKKSEVVKTKFKSKFFHSTASAGFWKEVGLWLVRIYNSSSTIIDVV